jgi:YVTN family beta-propeller protein
MSQRIRGALLIATLGGLSLGLLSCKPATKTADTVPVTDGGYSVYVTNETSGDLTVIDGLTRQVTATVALGKRPRGIRSSMDGKTLYIALSGSPVAGPGVEETTLPPADKSADGIAVFDVASGKVTKIITGMSDPEQMDISADGKLIIASEDTGQALIVDSSNGKVLSRIDAGEEPEGVNMTPDGKQAWVTSEGRHLVTVIDVASGKTIKTIEVGERPRNTAFSPDGTKAYVGGELDRVITVIDRATLTVSNRVKLPGDTLRPMDLKPSPDGSRLYVSTGRGAQVIALDSRSLSVVGSAKVGTRPWGLGLSPDGKTLYSANGPSNDVSVVDAATMRTIATVPAGRGPWSLAVVPR